MNNDGINLRWKWGRYRGAREFLDNLDIPFIRPNNFYTAPPLNSLKMAIEHYDIEKIHELLAMELDLDEPISNHPNAHAYPVLFTAVSQSKIEVIKLLLEAGANVDAPGLNGNTALIKACYDDDLEVLKLLIESGANINLSDERGKTPIISACDHGNLEVVKTLVESGADVNLTKNTSGSIGLLTDDAFLMALKYKHIEIVEYLIPHWKPTQERIDVSKKLIERMDLPELTSKFEKLEPCTA